VRFVLLGRLVEQKGHTIALEALAELTDINWQLKIVGDGPLKEKLHIYVTKNNIHDRVIFSEATRDITTVFEQTDIVLMPSRWEGFGIVAMEAMAAGRIVIAADTGGLAEIVRASENGYIFEAQNSFDLYNVMHDICMNKKDAISVAKKAQVYAEAHFSLQTMVDMYEKVYEILLNKK